MNELNSERAFDIRFSFVYVTVERVIAILWTREGSTFIMSFGFETLIETAWTIWARCVRR